MVNAIALSNGPVEFTNKNGQLVSIPLSLISFKGPTVVATGDVYTANKAEADPWLAYLAGIGELVPETSSSAPAPAMVITASHAGTAGNSIQIQFSNFDNSDPAHVKFDAVLSETDVYADLTLATLQTVVGKVAGAGLVSVGGSPPSLMPVASGPTTLVSPATSIDILSGSTGSPVSFTVSFRSTDTGATQTVQIKNVTGTTFTLIATWTKTASQIEVGDLTGAGAKFGSEVTVTAPSGGTLAPPSPGTITLNGGADAAGPVAASAIVLS